MTPKSNRRTAFTLVEMLVASALIIFMMYIIASAFESGLTSFRVLKAQGDMQEKLRNVTTMIRTDLASPHFGGKFFPSNQGPFLSQQRLNDQSWTPPEMGYFRISQPFFSLTSALTETSPEGLDPDGTMSPLTDPRTLIYLGLNPARSPTNLYLQFTVNLTDGHPSTRDARARRDQFFSTDTSAPAGLNNYSRPDYGIGDPSAPFSSNWAEVTYFLQRNGQTSGGPPLYSLYRRQKLLVEPNPNLSVTSRFPKFNNELDRNYPDVSSWFDTNRFNTSPAKPGYAFNSPADVTEPIRRFGMSLASWATGAAAPWNLTKPPPAHGQPQWPVWPVRPPPLPPYNPPLESPFFNVDGEAKSPSVDATLIPRVGADIVLTDILNFEVKVLWEPVRAGAPNTDKFLPVMVFNDGTAIVSPNFLDPSTANNPDYPFDVLPRGLNRGIDPNPKDPNLVVPRVFDTWSANNEPSTLPVLPQKFPYVYGVDPNAIDARDNVPLKSKSQSPNDPDYSNWNNGHFFEPPQLPVRTPTPPPQPNGPARWVPPRPPVGNQPGRPGVLTQPVPNMPEQTNIPLRVRVRALQIKVRIWDRKTSQTRQVTIIQDL